MLDNLTKLVNMEADLLVLLELEEKTGQDLSKAQEKLEYKIGDLINFIWDVAKMAGVRTKFKIYP